MEKEKVNRWSLEINQEVPSNIFERPVISARIKELMYEYTEAIDKRIEEIKEFINLPSCPELENSFIRDVFKSYFCNHIANEAVHIAFMEQNAYNIEKNIIQLLTKVNMRKAIFGTPMIDAFSRAIRILSMHKSDDGYNENVILYSDTILTLREHFISTKKKRNYCGGCGCSCTCDESCGGDYNKCTSDRECTHHCGCFLNVVGEKILQKRLIECSEPKHNINCDE